MASQANFAATPAVGRARVQVASINRQAPTNASTIFTPGVSGGEVERITVQPLGACVASALRIMRYDGANYSELMEVPVGSGNSATGTPLPPVSYQAADFPGLFPISVPSGSTLVATINDTQLAAEMSVNSIAQAQTTAGAVNLNLNGASVTAANATAVAAAAAPAANVPMTLTSAPYVATVPALLTLTSAANLSGVTYTVVGRKNDGSLVTENIVGPNNTTVFSVNAYKAILSIIPQSTNASTCSAGISTVAGSAIFTQPAPIILHSGANLSAINFTITGTTGGGIVQSEVLAGPNIGYVQSVNTYGTILKIATSGAVGTNVTVGNPAMLAGFEVSAEGGSF